MNLCTIGRVYRTCDGIVNTMWYLFPSIAKRDYTANFGVKSVTYSKTYVAKKDIELLEGHLMSDHVHMCLRVPPKFSIAFVVGFIKGKSAVLIHRKILSTRRVSGLHFWARGYCVSTVGLDEKTIRQYIRDQEKSEKAQLELDFS